MYEKIYELDQEFTTIRNLCAHGKGIGPLYVQFFRRAENPRDMIDMVMAGIDIMSDAAKFTSMNLEASYENVRKQIERYIANGGGACDILHYESSNGERMEIRMNVKVQPTMVRTDVDLKIENPPKKIVYPVTSGKRVIRIYGHQHTLYQPRILGGREYPVANAIYRDLKRHGAGSYHALNAQGNFYPILMRLLETVADDVDVIHSAYSANAVSNFKVLVQATPLCTASPTTCTCNYLLEINRYKYKN